MLRVVRGRKLAREDAIARERGGVPARQGGGGAGRRGDLLILEMEAKHSEMRMKLAQ